MLEFCQLESSSILSVILRVSLCDMTFAQAIRATFLDAKASKMNEESTIHFLLLYKVLS